MRRATLPRNRFPPSPLPASLAHIRQRRRWNTTQAPTTPSQSSPVSIDSILIANRGEIALRINKTASQHGIQTTTLYTDPDRHSQHALSSPLSFNLGSTSGYLDQQKIISIAKQYGCQAIHPGYGFLSENPQFAELCSENSIKFIGPPASAITDMGDKARSKEIMEAAKVPCVPGYHGSDQSPETLSAEAEKMGYPVLIKAVRGGGGKGMRIVNKPEEFDEMLDSAKSEARNSFGNDEVLVEKYIITPRHIEVQVFADMHGNCLALGERDCSIQRRHQKILEESPAPNLDDSIRKDLWAKARAAALAVGYEGAGTVEFIFDNDTGRFFFMEMNTRLQVEHPVTEMVTGLDLVHWQIMVAEGKPLPMTQDQVEEEIAKRGHAIEARIYAENPDNGFMPDSGTLLHVQLPQQSTEIRIDSGFVQGDEVSSHYDPMIAKLIVRGHDRKDAVRKMAAALSDYQVAGPITNIEFLKRICKSTDFMNGLVETGYIPKHHDELFSPQEVTTEVLAEAALATFLRSRPELPSEPQHSWTTPTTSPSWLQVSSSFQPHTFTFQLASTSAQPQTHSIQLQQTSPTNFTITHASQSIPVTATLNPLTQTLTTHFPTHRSTSCIVFPPEDSTSTQPPPITLFTPRGTYRLLPTAPSFLAKALGHKSTENSLLSPMPAKILRVAVKPGEEVKKDQILLVIESMKMETVVRSPGDGLVVKRVPHAEGEVVGGGVELVEFEESKEE